MNGGRGKGERIWGDGEEWLWWGNSGGRRTLVLRFSSFFFSCFSLSHPFLSSYIRVVVATRCYSSDGNSSENTTMDRVLESISLFAFNPPYPEYLDISYRAHERAHVYDNVE